MNQKKSSIDGFIPRRPDSQLGERHVVNAAYEAPGRRQLRNENDLQQNAAIGAARPGRIIGQSTSRPIGSSAGRSIGTSDIDDSLRQLDEIPEQHGRRKLSRKDKRRLKKEGRTKSQRVRRRIILGIIIVIAAILVAAGGYLAFKAFRASGNVLQGNFFDLIQNEPLKKDANGRSNFLILGTSEDDPGHEASYLTDSIMVMSIDQEKKNAYMFSIPRDLHVDYGTACMSGYKGKINVYFSCINEGTDDAAEQDRLDKTQAFIGDIVGLDIQYGVHVNYTVMRDVVNAIGGSITVNIDSRHPDGVMDSNFDWKCGANIAKRKQTCPPNGHFIDYPNGAATLDAEHALYLAQARGDRAPTYGFEQSNFDRERNQQMIAVAIRDKAMSSGTLTNLGAVTGLIDALGNNLRTNIETKEIRTLMTLAQEIPGDSIQSLDFFSDDNRLFTTGPINGASSVYPAEGVFKYSDLRAFIKRQLTADPFVKEEPHVSVYNGSGTAGVAQTAADELEDIGYLIDLIDNAPDGTYQAVEIYQIATDKPASVAKLKELYGVTPKTTTPPVSVTGETDFVIIIGNASVVENSNGQ